MPRTKFTGDLEAALEALQRKIAEGWEYPDAQWSVSRAYKVNPDELQEAYDAS